MVKIISDVVFIALAFSIGLIASTFIIGFTIGLMFT